MSVQLGFGGDAGGKGLTSLFCSLILLLFVGGLAAFFLINPGRNGCHLRSLSCCSYA
jgi:hypothetical protein